MKGHEGMCALAHLCCQRGRLPIPLLDTVLSGQRPRSQSSQFGPRVRVYR